jgi:uncharacterized protein YecE (DUF72 family)
MDFGRLENIDHVDFSLPKDHPATTKILRGKATTNPKVYIGCPIWTEKGWVGKIYPKGIKDKDYLKYYAKHFNSIELNTTHYRIPDSTTIERWNEATSSEFRFCPKVPQTISHASNILGMIDQMKYFYESVAPLNEKLGIIFLQLSPFFSAANVSALLKFLESIPQGYPLAIELRHESWFEGNKNSEELFSYMEAHKITTVITDVAGRRDALHQRLTTKSAFIRFTGNNLHPTDFPRMTDWTKRVAEWISHGLEEVYFFMHTPDKALCLEMAEYFTTEINKLGIATKKMSIENNYKQGSLFD